MTELVSGFNPTYVEEQLTPEQVINLPGDVLLEFGAPWCGHCIAAQPAVEASMEETPALAHIKVYDGKGKKLGRAFRVKLWPTLILLRDGKELARVVRPLTKQDLHDLQKQL